MFDCLYSTDIEECGFEPWQDELWEYSFNAVDLSRFWLTEIDGDTVPDITRCLNEIKEHTYGYIKVGVISWVVRTRKFYTTWCSTFTEFCSKHLGRSVWQINRVIDASQVALTLMSYGFKQLPLNESQCRALTGLDESTLIDTWQYITENVPSEKITGTVVQAIVENWNKLDSDYKKVKPKTVKLDRNRWDKLQEKATLLGVNPKDLLDKLIDNYLSSESDDIANAEINTANADNNIFPPYNCPPTLSERKGEKNTDKEYIYVTKNDDNGDKLLTLFNALMGKGLGSATDTS